MEKLSAVTPGDRTPFNGESHCLSQKLPWLHLEGAGLCSVMPQGQPRAGMDSLEPQH